MQSWLITDIEDDKLQGMTADAQIIYLRAFRRYMDFKTGVAGGHGATITLQSLKRLIEFVPDKGSSAKARRFSDVSTDYIRSRLAELLRGGLIEKREDKQQFDHLVFFLPLARIGNSAPEYEPQKNPKEQPQESPKEGIQKTSGIDRIDNTEEPQGDIAKNPNNTGIQENLSLDKSKEIVGKKTRTKKPPLEIILPEWIERESWMRFEAHRKERNKKITESSRPLLFQQLEGLDFNQQRQVIEYSIRAGYPDLYPNKATPAKPQAKVINGNFQSKDYGITECNLPGWPG